MYRMLTCRQWAGGIVLLGGALVAGPLHALDASCGICATEITLDEPLAACFLDRYHDYSAEDGMAVAVRLDDCPTDRGVVEALSSPGAGSIAPDTRFLLTRTQLACLKERLEQPGIVLDPSVTVQLDDCE